ncbi:hypothetical protein JG687_00014820 [Phytophthora cactorum]|uniref:Uncharacterized protein n=1 Tax=Phytophthora cactorum TaxID=29920 RepID=A0A8T1TWL1_9STRA|nr:hypothetical protein JG687_00014820 [Phytophthora cactorum]
MDTFIEAGGTEAIVSMTNFPPTELSRLRYDIVGFVRTSWNIRRGKKCKTPGKDVLIALPGENEGFLSQEY